MGYLLEVKDLSVHYVTSQGDAAALNNLTLHLNEGQIMGLVGETGAGKTTLAKSIMRILPTPPAQVQSGEILMNGRNLLALSEKEMRKIRGWDISMIFQDPMTAINPTIRIGEQIEEVIKLHEDVSKAEARAKAKKLLATVGITADRFNDYPMQFSGGMKQRVVIAMALACRPKLLLADEPTTALDVTIQAQIIELMKALKDEYKMAMIMITHDLGIVAELCDSVGVIYAGELIESGTIEDIFENTKHPYTKGLFDSLPDLDGREPRLKSIKGLMPNARALPKGCKFHPRCPYATEECDCRDVSLREVETGHFVRCLKSEEGLL